MIYFDCIMCFVQFMHHVQKRPLSFFSKSVKNQLILIIVGLQKPVEI